MAQLAIKGHPIRGNEVIKLLEMLGGKIQRDKLGGNEIFCWYYINENGYINYKHHSLFDDTKVFTLEEFLEKFPYKVGDKVMTDDGDKINIVGMFWDNDIDDVFYETRICDEVFKYPKELLQPYKEETMEEKNYPPYMDYDEKTIKKEILPYFLTVYDSEENKHEIVATDGYEIKEENGKYYAVKKKLKYPKTYAECCSILGRTLPTNDDIEGYKWELITNFQGILVCRDAYWKIAGEQMELGKSWKPDLQNKKETKYVITNVGDNIAFEKYAEYNGILSFPTSEMRDIFYANFENLIEQCKELL